MSNRSFAVSEVQTWLRALSKANPNIHEINIDGIYGPETEEAVKNFQAIYNLPVTGIVDYITWREIFYKFATLIEQTGVPASIQPFTLGLHMNRISKGEQFSLIYILQVMLEAFSILNHDIFNVDINGVYDDKTDSAVKIFQDRNNLPITDYVDKRTWDRLCAFYNNYLSEINK